MRRKKIHYSQRSIYVRTHRPVKMFERVYFRLNSVSNYDGTRADAFVQFEFVAMLATM